jgi:hypothetical protein
LGKVAHRVAQGIDVFTELEIQAGQVVHGFSLWGFTLSVEHWALGIGHWALVVCEVEVFSR